MERSAQANTQTLIMGVVNVTPDSFSDGGAYREPSRAIEKIEQLFEDGADIVDIGAESSRPGAEAIDSDEEWRRLEPVLSGIAKRRLPGQLSIDTYKPQTMLRATDFGVSLINDIKGGADDKTLQILAAGGMTYIAMHMRHDPTVMQERPLEGQDAVLTVDGFVTKIGERLRSLGFSKDRLWFDPGIGFGKTDAANLQLIRFALETAGHTPWVLGVSRKSFIGRLLGLSNPLDRDAPSKMLELSFLMKDIRAVRTHDVLRLRQMRDLLDRH